jgi:uncharacterized membrane protein
MAIKLTKRIKKQFLTGLIVILPVGLTAWIVWVLFRLIGERFLPLFENIPYISELPLPAQMFISAVLTVCVIWFIGLWARNYIGKHTFVWFESILLKTPVVSKIYSTIRQIIHTMFVNKQAFKEVALIEYPRRGIYTIAFVTNHIGKENNPGFVTVFVPSTPNPTTGYCILLPEKDVEVLSININQAMEFVFSGGIIVPGQLNELLSSKKVEMCKEEE